MSYIVYVFPSVSLSMKFNLTFDKSIKSCLDRIQGFIKGQIKFYPPPPPSVNKVTPPLVNKVVPTLPHPTLSPPLLSVIIHYKI